MTVKTAAEYRDEARCAACGGRCCVIYYPARCVVTPMEKSWWYGEYSDFFHWDRDNYGVAPRYFPAVVNAPGSPESVRRALRAQGIDPDACEYLGPGGCIIPWDRRPEQCRSHRCLAWEQAGEGG